MGNIIHRMVPLQIWTDVDEGIVALVRELNTIADVRTHASCQGTIGEGGAEPYPAYVSVSWLNDKARDYLQTHYKLKIEGK